MKILLKENVLEAARQRVAYFFDEFPNVVVGFSGGKDSTVVLNLAIEEARARGRLPLTVVFIDQEAEWQAVVDYARRTMARPEVKPCWLQVPMKISNATSSTVPWLECWKEGSDWIREKEPNSIHENVFGTDRFYDLFNAVIKHLFPDSKACLLGGVRCEESPGRHAGLTSNPKYKDVTYGKTLNRKLQHFTFYPIYDWTWRDVWKAIHEQGWEYCPIYDTMYQYGVRVPDMRVSSLHHETAMQKLFWLQEIEPETWDKVAGRLAGVNAAAHFQIEGFRALELPRMFDSWKEYRDFLCERLPTDPEIKAKFRTKFAQMDGYYAGMHHIDEMHRQHVTTLLKNDYHFTLLHNWSVKPTVFAWVRHTKRGITHPSHARNKYIHG